ncbi:hypothetical protein ACMD2_02215 [Ananas comosus]|uniref:Uncharacterized protein n=2 Tax=Ananas comosus TaxID=4615 RepID=A0A199VNW2_ANACO|nr:hypothetical protein ACMD2_02215 [Ananas comosus]
MAPSTSAAAARVSLVLSLLIFASSISVSSSSSSSASPKNRLDISGEAARRRAILAHASAAATAGGAECRELGSREECARSPRRCRWCRSDAIDDMCFGSAEAWRLPHQVFSCDPIPVAAAS